jgi:hypothetical protein
MKRQISAATRQPCLVPTPQAARLAGITSQRLREWTSRRGLIHADIKPKGPGSAARYAWQTILRLRIAVILRDRFKLDLQAHRDLFFGLMVSLDETPFDSLWGKSLALYGGSRFAWVDMRVSLPQEVDCVLLPLDPHLQVLAEAFSLAGPAMTECCD